MADYNSMKVPELKKLLSERGLTQAGNKADLIARLVENDKSQAKDEEPASATEAKKGAVEDEIDYDDDDFPTLPTTSATTKPETTTPAPASSTPAPVSAPSTTPAPTKPAVSETKTDAPAATTTAPATTDATENGADKKTTEATFDAPLFSQHLAPTNAKTEAEKRAARAARFGVITEKESEDAKKVVRAERFGVADDAVAALDSALPDRPRKRGRDRGAEDKEDDSRANKRGPGGAGRPAQGGGRNNAGGRGGQSNRGGNRNNRRDRRGGSPKEAGGGNAQKKAPAIDPAEKAKLEARAKRFATA